MSVKIILACDHLLTRQVSRRDIENDPENEIIAEVETGKEALELTLALQPDILISDMRFPDRITGEEIAKVLSEKGSVTKLIVQSVEKDGYTAHACLRAGASAYNCKFGQVDLDEVIRVVRRGERFVAPELREEFEKAVLSWKARLEFRLERARLAQNKPKLS
jgi:DNA-binding NarL/FixJ family response regulator